jgi:hypothetical protein
MTNWPREAPRCLVLDIQLPGISGLDLQQELASGDAQIPIVFVPSGQRSGADYSGFPGLTIRRRSHRQTGCPHSWFSINDKSFGSGGFKVHESFRAVSIAWSSSSSFFLVKWFVQKRHRASFKGLPSLNVVIVHNRNERNSRHLKSLAPFSIHTPEDDGEPQNRPVQPS